MHAVFTAADLNGDVREAWYTGTGNQVPDTPRPPLAEGEARFAGDPVALVVADSRYLAEDAAELVEVDYEPLPGGRRLRDRRIDVRCAWSTTSTRATSRASSAARRPRRSRTPSTPRPT